MNNLFNKRIPTLFGLLIIVIGIGITSFLTHQGIIFTGQASPTDEPANIQISNVTDSSFTVSYTTEGAVFGSINMGTNSGLGNTILDDRDKTLTAHRTHTMTAKKLSPETTYYFAIISGENTFINNGVLYSVTTGPSLNKSSALQRESVTGRIIMPSGEIPMEAMVYLDIEGAQTLSAFAKSNGSYNIPLNLLRTSDLSSYYSLAEKAKVKLVILGDSLKSNVSLTAGGISQIPTITLSQNYDFTISNSPLRQNETNATPSAEVAFPTATPSSSLNNDIQIITPKEGQGFSDDQPLFRGKAQPNESVEISIHSEEEIRTTVTTDANGNWTYRPTTSLSPGEHIISITTRDAFGILKTITQQFTVYASGSQVNESATPSATLIPTTTPTLTIAPISTASPTETPILTPSPTASPTIALPPSGGNALTTIGIFATLLIVAGGLLFIFTRVGI